MDYKKYAIADIHLHLDGSLSAKAIINVAKEEGIKLPSYCPHKLNKYLRVPKNCKSLNEYLERFALPNLVLQTKNGLRKCSLDLLERLAKQGLKYCEIRMAPQLSTAQGLSQKEVVETLIQTFNEQKFIRANLILCLMRGEDTHEANMETIEVAKEFYCKGVVAIDLAGAEALFENQLFEKEFKLAQKYKLPFTIHAGEAGDAKSVQSAVEMGASRIGHGIHSVDDKNVLELLKKRGICLEICPKSNLDTKTIKSYSELPLKKLKEAGVKVSINTDDMTVSNTELWKEYRTLTKLGFKENELQEFALNTIDAAFVSDAEKVILKKFIK